MPPRLTAQTTDTTTTDSSSTTLTTADKQWADLQAALLSLYSQFDLVTGLADAATLDQQQLQLTAGLVDVADLAHAFRQLYPNHPKAPMARSLEAKNLLKVVLLGETTYEASAMAVAEEVKLDTSLPLHARYEVTFLAELCHDRAVAQSRADYLTAREVSARYLMTVYPAEAGGYQLLLAVAEAARDTDKLQAVAKEVIYLPAPFEAQAKARIWARRFELVGKSLADVANTALGRDNLFEQARAKQAIAYTWASWNVDSIKLAKEIAAQLPPGAIMIGVCLDRDLAAAQAVAARESLQGLQFYNEGGPLSQLALLLKLNAPSQVYLTDQQGVIRNVTVKRDTLAAALAALAVH